MATREPVEVREDLNDILDEWYGADRADWMD